MILEWSLILGFLLSTYGEVIEYSVTFATEAECHQRAEELWEEIWNKDGIDIDWECYARFACFEKLTTDK